MFFVLPGCLRALTECIVKWTKKGEARESYTCLDDKFRRTPRTAPPAACKRSRAS